MFSSTSIADGAIRVLSSTPSATAASISAGKAVISATLLLYAILTFFAPILFAVLTASMDTFPPPIIQTFLPVRSFIIFFPTSRRNSTADTTPFASSCSSPSFLSVLAPIVISTASKAFLKSSIVISSPILRPCLTSTPVFKIALISSSSLFFGNL